MSQAVSPSVGHCYGLARICRRWKVARSSFYLWRSRRDAPALLSVKRGPKNVLSDEEIVEKARAVQADSPWVGEGHRKTWARLRHAGVRTSRRRLLRLMRENGMLAPHAVRKNEPKSHESSIIPEAPDQLWGTDATATLTGEGTATIFVVVDHSSAESLGVHAARRGTRFEAIEALRQAVRASFGAFEQDVASVAELALRHDHGSQFMSHAYQDELRFLGITSSPAFVREPETNGCAERFIRTLKEQLLWLKKFETVAALNAALKQFQERYNNEWLIERHGWISPSEYRRRARQEPVVAA